MENEGQSSPSQLGHVRGITVKDVAYMEEEAWEDVKADSISKVWHQTLLNRVDQLGRAVA